jgi:dipeptidyl-peptidase-4
MNPRSARSIVFVALMPLMALPAAAQGTQADYERAARFLNGDLGKLVQPADITPVWVEGSEQFWYRKSGPDTEFVLVDTAKNTRGPAFDHAKLAEELSTSMGRQIRANHLPFHSFEFTEKGAAIRFEAEGQRWTCSVFYL